MNVISRIIAALVATALGWIGARLGIEFTPEDHATATVWATGLLVASYGILHPIVRSWLLSLRGKQEAPPIPQHTATVVTPKTPTGAKVEVRP